MIINYTICELRIELIIPRLIAALHIPEIIIRDNGSIMPGEEAFLMLLYWFSFSRTLASAQEFYGLEYSQISIL